MTEPKLFGLVLTGGQSARMGFDKSQLSFHGVPQLVYLEKLLESLCDAVYVSRKSLSSGNNNVLADKFEINTPLNGILTAMDFSPANAWLTVPIDMPGVDEHVLQYLIHHRDRSAMATCFLDEEGIKPEPLVTIWEPAAYPLMKAFYQSNKVSPREFLMSVDCQMIIAPNRQFHQNINTPEELSTYKRLSDHLE